MKKSPTKSNCNNNSGNNFNSKRIKKISKLVPNRISEVTSQRMRITDQNQNQISGKNEILKNNTKGVLKKLPLENENENQNHYKLCYPEYPKALNLNSNSNDAHSKNNCNFIKLKMSIKKVESKFGISHNNNNKNKNCKKCKKISIEFFEPDENDNDLEKKNHLSSSRINLLKLNRFAISDKNKSLIFEKDMKKHGLMKNIKEIYVLNKKMQKEIGSSREFSVDPENSFDPKVNSSCNDKRIIFPFQKRPRSNSPPNHLKNSSLQMNTSGIKKKPVPIIPINFFYHKGKESVWINGTSKPEEKESKNPPDESLDSIINDKQPDWLFQRINKAELPRKPNGDNEDEINFVSLLNELNNNGY